MKFVIVTIAVGIITVGGNVFGNNGLTPEQRVARKATRQRIYDGYYGGIIEDERNQHGVVSLVNAQTRVPINEVKEPISWLRETMKVRIAVADGKFDIANVEKRGNVSIFIIDDKALPPTLLAPEQLWAVVNVAWIQSEKRQFTKARLGKQIVRVFSQLCGGASSNYDNPIVSHVAKATDLDDITDFRLPIDLIKRCTKYLQKCGVTQSRKSTYRQACEEGWAPPPTNDVQRAIWEETHAIPKAPMKIEFDPKKGR